MNAQPSFLSPTRALSDNAQRMEVDPPSPKATVVHGVQSSPLDLAANGDAAFRQAHADFLRGDQKHARDLAGRAVALWQRAGVV